jgi:hypothetical protein
MTDTLEGRQSAGMDIIRITPMRVRLTASTVRNGSLGACSSVLGRGTTGGTQDIGVTVDTGAMPDTTDAVTLEVTDTAMHERIMDATMPVTTATAGTDAGTPVVDSMAAEPFVAAAFTAADTVEDTAKPRLGE